MKNIFHTSLQGRREEAARRYAGANKSDPHAFNRAMCHSANGVVSFRTVKLNGKEQEQHCQYDADTFPGTRDLDPRWAPLNKLRERPMNEVGVTIYKNVCRP